MKIFTMTVVLSLMFSSSLFAYGKMKQSPSYTAGPTHSGKIIEVLQTKNYTYINVKGEKNTYWAAVGKQAIKKGKIVSFSLSNAYENFESKSLKRTFKKLYLISNLEGGVANTGHGRAKVAKKIKIGKIKKAKHTVNDLFTKRKKLASKEVQFRGVVVKYMAEVMGSNWLHIQDGTGKKGFDDITVTTNAKVNVGDTVLVKGKLSVNKDFGHGYVYDLIVEKADVTISK